MATRKRALERGYDDFTGYNQNDSQEFLQFLLNHSITVYLNK